MKIAFFCVLVNSLLPVVWAGYAKLSGGFKMEDNKNPREVLAKVTGKSQRALWAQMNAWEAFAPFAAAVIIASLSQVSSGQLATAAIVYTIARIAYGFCYIKDLATLRSTVWGVGMGVNIYLYILALS